MNSKKKYTDFVNVFQGNGTVENKPTGVAASWHPIKGLAGNTHPGAQLPFGKISVGAYSGGYPTGYGNNRKNTGELVASLYGKKKIIGISHIHHSGVGGIGYYYNYALTVPFYGLLSEPDVCNLCNESARPGYYSCTVGEKSIGIEVTADNYAARHRYSFGKNGGRISVDFSNDGLYKHKELRSYAGDAVLKIVDDHTVTSEVVLHGMKLYFCVYCATATAELWENYEKSEARILNTNGDGGRKFGCVFNGCTAETELCLSVSLRGIQKAVNDNIKARERNFDLVCTDADKIWNEVLSGIRITADEAQKEVFYSALYHTLVKPSDWSGESVYYNDNDFVVGFSTLWDIYKTQLPLVFTLYSEISIKIVRTYMQIGKSLNSYPNAVGLVTDLNVEAKQAKLLAGGIFCDAYYRGVGGVDYAEVCEAIKDELLKDEYSDFFLKGECERTTHTLDLAECCGNVADMAEVIGNSAVSSALRPFEDNWKNAFDANTGLLKDGYRYYEGDRWNYSFRLMRKMKERIEMCGGKFVEYLNRFFGFTDNEDDSERFEGFNNETDMESPYAYAYTDRHDLLCRVLNDGMKSLFGKSEGGIPGNNDSGGLSSCYIWNMLGIFPVSGQDLMLIGTPAYESASLKLANGKTFTVKRIGKGIYTERAVLNGVELDFPRFSVSEMMGGGTLELFMTDRTIIN